jgi:glyoxylase-like metal-dependent hydrolase (beta-lactamase superfamily II)
VDVAEIERGLWRWTGFHETWKDNVGCVYCETDDGVVLVDPLVPPEDSERFWAALDRDVERVGDDVHVLLTVFWHVRSVGTVVERYGARTWVPTATRPAVTRRGVPVSDPFRPGDPLPGGLEAFRTARAAEVVYWLPQHRALVPGDVLIGDGEGGVRLCPESWLPATKSLADLAESLRPLLDLPVERILVSHGEPVLRGGKRALARALDAP